MAALESSFNTPILPTIQQVHVTGTVPTGASWAEVIQVNVTRSGGTVDHFIQSFTFPEGEVDETYDFIIVPGLTGTEAATVEYKGNLSVELI